MTRRVTILERVYGPWAKQGIKAAYMLLRGEVADLEVEVKEVSVDEKGRIIVVLEGEDEEAAGTYLARKYGYTRSIKEVVEGENYRGRIVQPFSYGYGLYVDIGVVAPSPKDALLPLYTLRRQLAGGRQAPLRRIIRVYGFIENLPLGVRVVDVDPAGRIEAELSDGEIEKLDEWAKTRFDRVIVCGATRQQVRRAIIKSGHLKDIVSIERLGLMEHAIICKYGTDAPGIIAEIGGYLEGVPMKAFIPKEVREFMREKKPSRSLPHL